MGLPRARVDGQEASAAISVQTTYPRGKAQRNERHRGVESATEFETSPIPRPSRGRKGTVGRISHRPCCSVLLGGRLNGRWGPLVTSRHWEESMMAREETSPEVRLGGQLIASIAR